jgi:hypothetical protein
LESAVQPIVMNCSVDTFKAAVSPSNADL